MNKRNLAVFALALIGGVALAAVYKWVDESGRVHYGDSPPPASEAQPVTVPEGPSAVDVERARQQMREKIQKYEEFSDQARPTEPQEKAVQEAEIGVAIPDDVTCMSPLSDLVAGPSAETYTPITPTALTEAQRKTLSNLFEQVEAVWSGAIVEVTCQGGSAERAGKTANFRARMTADWDARKSQLMLDTDSVGEESGVSKRRIYRAEVDDFLYFTDIKGTDIIAQPGNMVEVLGLDRNEMLFLIKRRIATGAGARRPRAEVRHLEIAGRTLKLVELYYHNGMLTGWSTWILDR